MSPRWQRPLLKLARHAGWVFAAWIVAGAFGASAFGLEPSPMWLFIGALSAVTAVIFFSWGRSQRDRLIREVPLPRMLQRKLRESYSYLSQKDVELVERGLRQFFLACHRSRGAFVAMPSRVVDTLWHEFILHTQAYRDWCDLTLGRFVHHTPAEVLGASVQHNDGLRRAWYWACKDEAIDPRAPSRLPLLFALDTKLDIPGGFHYEPDCGAPRRRPMEGAAAAAAGAAAYVHCATSFGDISIAGDAAGFGGSESTSDASSSDGDGGCGGGGGD